MDKFSGFNLNSTSNSNSMGLGSNFLSNSGTFFRNNNGPQNNANSFSLMNTRQGYQNQNSSAVNLNSFPNPNSTFSTINNYTMPTVMFNEPHIPVLLPTQANYMGDYQGFKEVLENVRKAKKIADLLEFEESKLKEMDDIRYRDLLMSRLNMREKYPKKDWADKSVDLTALREA